MTSSFRLALANAVGVDQHPRVRPGVHRPRAVGGVPRPGAAVAGPRRWTPTGCRNHPGAPGHLNEVLDHALAVQAQILPIAGGTGPQASCARRCASWPAPLTQGWNTQMFVKARTTRRVEFDTIGHDGLVGMHARLTRSRASRWSSTCSKPRRVTPRPTPRTSAAWTNAWCDALVGTVLGTAPGDPSTPMSPKVLVNVFTPLNTLLKTPNTSPPGTTAAPTVTDQDGHVPGELGTRHHNADRAGPQRRAHRRGRARRHRRRHQHLHQ